MDYMKCISGDYIVSLHLVNGNGNIDKIEYDELKELFQNRPIATEGYQYMLRADSLEWEMVEAPPEPEPTAEEALSIMLGENE